MLGGHCQHLGSPLFTPQVGEVGVWGVIPILQISNYLLGLSQYISEFRQYLPHAEGPKLPLQCVKYSLYVFTIFSHIPYKVTKWTCTTKCYYVGSTNMDSVNTFKIPFKAQKCIYVTLRKESLTLPLNLFWLGVSSCGFSTFSFCLLSGSRVWFLACLWSTCCMCVFSACMLSDISMSLTNGSIIFLLTTTESVTKDWRSDSAIKGWAQNENCKRLCSLSRQFLMNALNVDISVLLRNK